MTSFPRMLTGKILRIPPYLVGTRENTDRKKLRQVFKVYE